MKQHAVREGLVQRCPKLLLSHQALRHAGMPHRQDTLPGLGPKSRAMLAAAGLHHRTDLERAGAVKAFLLVQATGQRPSLNLLWALEGALTGLDWRTVAREHHTSLLLALETASKP